MRKNAKILTQTNVFWRMQLRPSGTVADKSQIPRANHMTFRGMYRTNSSENKSCLFCYWFYSLSNQNWNFYKCIFSNYLKWTLFVLLLDSVAWFVPEICHFEIDWSEFHVSKHGKNGHPPSSRWRCKLS